MLNKRYTEQQKQRGAALMLFVIFFLFGSGALTYLIAKGVFADLLGYRLLQNSARSYYAAESSLEDVAYRYIASGFDVDSTETLTVDGASATTDNVFDSGTGVLTIDATGDANGAIRKASMVLLVGAGASFNFGVQTGNGGFHMTNSSKVIGNVFSNGNIIGGNPSLIEGDVIAAGDGNLVDGVHATGSVRADNIHNSTIDMYSFYVTSFVNNSVTNPPYAPQQVAEPEATSSLPFPDDKVDDHKASVTAAIAAGDGTLIDAGSSECSGGYVIDSDTTLSGPYKIECDVLFDKNNTDVTLTDTLWIEGDFAVKNARVIADPATSTDSILVIVDNATDRITSSKIVLDGAKFEAPTSPKSYIMLLSMNEDAENGGSETAINIGNSTGKDDKDDFLAYAGHGKITLSQQIYLKELTGYLIEMGNNTTVEYESGLISLSFTSGPGGGFEIDGWEEVASF